MNSIEPKQKAGHGIVPALWKSLGSEPSGCLCDVPAIPGVVVQGDDEDAGGGHERECHLGIDESPDVERQGEGGEDQSFHVLNTRQNVKSYTRVRKFYPA